MTDRPTTLHREMSFPDARPTRALRDENAFMADHGGAGSQMIYGLVSGIAAAMFWRPRLTGANKKPRAPWMPEVKLKLRGLLTLW